MIDAADVVIAWEDDDRGRVDIVVVAEVSKLPSLADLENVRGASVDGDWLKSPSATPRRSSCTWPRPASGIKGSSSTPFPASRTLPNAAGRATSTRLRCASAVATDVHVHVPNEHSREK